MWIRSLRNQLLRDLKASWQKTALLGVLLLVGLWFWIPPLVRITFGRHELPVATAAAAAPTPPPVTAETSFARGQAVESRPVVGQASWETIDAAMQSDPLVQSVEVAAISSNPFQLKLEHLPPPVLFAEEPKPVTPPPQQVSLTRESNEGLVLRSTVIGVERRAALINNRLYYEGREIPFNGRTWTLTAVFTNRVILTDGAETMELRLPRRAGPDLPPSNDPQ